MSTSVSSVTSHFPSAENGFTTTLASTISSGAATVPLNSVAGYANGEVVVFIVDPSDLSKKQTFTGTVDTSGVQITGVVWTSGTNQTHTAGATVVDYVDAAHISMVSKGLLVEHDQDGTHGAITPTSVVSSGPVTGTVGTFDSVVINGTATSQGWTALGATPTTVTANSSVPRVFDMVFSAVDLTDTLSNGMKLQCARTVAAPSQCTSLNGTNQYYSKSSPSGMTFTDTFTVSAWIKLASYNGTIQTIASRYNGTSGWRFYLEATGQLVIAGYNAASTNNRFMTSYASVPLNKWVHVAASFSMSDHTASTCKMMFDGIDVGGTIGSGGTNPTALVQAGNLELGASNSGVTPFNGKLAQVAIYSAVITPATILASINRTLSGSETNLISAYSFNNTINDLNTSNANNLTAQNSAVATNADSPFANGVSAGSLEYAEVLNVSYSTDTTVTVRVPDGCQLPTTGGISSVYYSTQSNPYGLPAFSKIIGEVIKASAQGNITTETDVLGVSIPVYVPNGRCIRLAYTGIASGAAGRRLSVNIKEGSTAYQQIISGELTDSLTINSYIDIYPTSGVHTYKTTVLGRGGVAVTLDGNVAYPTVLTVELV